MPKIRSVTWAIPVALAIGAQAGWAQDAPATDTTAAQVESLQDPIRSQGDTTAAQVESLQDRIRSQPEMMEAISALQADPDFQDVLRDPDVAAALESGDAAALLTNPKITGLIDNPTVQEITKQLAQ